MMRMYGCSLWLRDVAENVGSSLDWGKHFQAFSSILGILVKVHLPKTLNGAIALTDFDKIWNEYSYCPGVQQTNFIFKDYLTGEMK